MTNEEKLKELQLNETLSFKPMTFGSYSIQNNDGMMTQTIAITATNSDEEYYANRIVDCVNAFAGVDEPKFWMVEVKNLLLGLRMAADSLNSADLADAALALFPPMEASND